jgi:DnaJ-class molecular chaperone
MPRSREEALQVLGMGVTRDATETAIKKIVDGLRLSWHPDYATNPEDRRMRELRVKQVNAAWDIIKHRRVQT